MNPCPSASTDGPSRLSRFFFPKSKAPLACGQSAEGIWTTAILQRVNALIFFGHLGLTAGAFKAYETAASHYKIKKLPTIDYRFVLAGSILPDVIDKPIGAIFFINTYHNSRIYGHTLLFSLMILLFGVYFLKKRGTSSVLVLGFGSLIHLILDSMWQYPETLFWPFLNLGAALHAKSGRLSVLLRFPYRFDNWLAHDAETIFQSPMPWIFELAGFMILAFFLIRLLRRHQLVCFLKTGKL